MTDRGNDLFRFNFVDSEILYALQYVAKNFKALLSKPQIRNVFVNIPRSQ